MLGDRGPSRRPRADHPGRERLIAEHGPEVALRDIAMAAGQRNNRRCTTTSVPEMG